MVKFRCPDCPTKNQKIKELTEAKKKLIDEKKVVDKQLVEADARYEKLAKRNKKLVTDLSKVTDQLEQMTLEKRELVGLVGTFRDSAVTIHDHM